VPTSTNTTEPTETNTPQPTNTLAAASTPVQEVAGESTGPAVELPETGSGSSSGASGLAQTALLFLAATLGLAGIGLATRRRLG
jgi:uncharacterized protein HemX